MTHHTSEHRDPAMNGCIESCSHCHIVCLETIKYCLGRGGKHADPQHVALMAACADICATCADTMLGGSVASAAVCGACAEVCRQCAESCEALGDDAEMKRCAQACRRCAESCAAMARM